MKLSYVMILGYIWLNFGIVEQQLSKCAITQSKNFSKME